MEPSHFCGKLACLGEPWCTEWQSCNFHKEVEKPVLEGISKNEMKEVKISQVQHRFANPKRLMRCVLPLYQRKRRKTRNTVCIFGMLGGKRESLVMRRDEVALEADKQIMPLLQMNKEVMKHWLTLFVLEVRKQNGILIHYTHCL